MCVISCIPFIKDMYGISGPWCGIKTLNKDGCLDNDLQKFSLGFTIITFCPQLGCLIVSLPCIVGTIISYLRVPKLLQGQGRVRYRNAIRFIGMIFLCAVIYSLLSLLPLVNRMYVFYYTNLKNHPPNYSLWIMHAVAEPSRVIMLVLALLVNPDMQKSIKVCFCKTSRKKHKATTPWPLLRSTRFSEPLNTFLGVPYSSRFKPI